MLEIKGIEFYKEVVVGEEWTERICLLVELGGCVVLFLIMVIRSIVLDILFLKFFL